MNRNQQRCDKLESPITHSLEVHFCLADEPSRTFRKYRHNSFFFFFDKLFSFLSFHLPLRVKKSVLRSLKQQTGAFYLLRDVLNMIRFRTFFFPPQKRLDYLWGPPSFLKWVTGFFPEGKRKFDPSCPSSREVTNEWNCVSAPIRLYGLNRDTSSSDRRVTFVNAKNASLQSAVGVFFLQESVMYLYKFN
jgi:hypothetical protein